MDDLRVDIGYIVRLERQRCGMTQRELAEHLGVSRPAISEIENGRRHLKAQEAGKLARLFSVGAEWLCAPPEAGTFRYAPRGGEGDGR